MSGWAVWFCRDGLRYPIATVAHSSFAGSYYRFARLNGRVVKFWTRKGAQAYADKLNAEQPTGHGAGVSDA